MQLTISTQDQQIVLSTALKTSHIEATDELQSTLKSLCDAYQDCHSIPDYKQSQDTLLTIGNLLYQTINSYQLLMQDWLNDGGNSQFEFC